MGLLRSIWSLVQGRTDEDAYRNYRARLIEWAGRAHQLSDQEFTTRYEGVYLDAAGRDLFLDYLLSLSKQSPSYITDHPRMLADRKSLFDRFGLPVLTMGELRDQENQRLSRMDSPLRV